MTCLRASAGGSTPARNGAPDGQPTNSKKDIDFALGTGVKRISSSDNGPAYDDDDIRLRRGKAEFSVKLPRGVDLSLTPQEQAVLERKYKAEEAARNDSENNPSEEPKSDLDIMREELRRMAAKWEEGTQKE